MNRGIFIGGFIIVWGILLHDQMGLTPLICGTVITSIGLICEALDRNKDSD